MATTTELDVFSNVKEGSMTLASGSGIIVVEIDLASYNALETKDPNTLYLITSTDSSSSSSSSSE